MRALILLVLLAAFAYAAPVYQLENLQRTNIGYTGDLELQSGSGPYGSDYKSLKFEMTLETDTRIRVRITDRANRRWQVPNIVKTPKPTQPPKNPKYTVDIKTLPFGFTVSRYPNREVIFSTIDVPFVFEDQFITIGTTFPKADPNLYGIGERAAPFRLETDNSRYTMFNLDNLNAYKENLYGTHPFFMEFRNNSAYGVWLLNSNAQDVTIQNKPRPSLNFITVGGVIDLFIFLGPTPSDVIKQYHEVIGLPFLPPFWGLGWHQCRYGYHDIDEVKTVVQKYKENGIPLDTMWNDIDYMQDYKDFTWDKDRFPQNQVKEFVDELHNNNQQYIVIVDPGIHAEKGYAPYDIGVEQSLFIKKSDNSTPIINKVWPGYCAFPDFTNPRTYPYWENLISEFLQGVSVDGLWLDMNEIAAFCEGEGPCPPPPITPDDRTDYVYSFNQSKVNNRFGFDPMYPPYVPGSQYNRTLSAKTIRMDSILALGLNYDVHNIYNLYEIEATMKALEKLRKKRAMIVTRSNFAGMGTMSAHWTGDNYSTWKSLQLSLSGILNHQLFGIPFTGSDICGFLGNTTYELCARWTQAGSLYPFSRNHNGLGEKSQEPYVFDEKFTVMARNVLLNRYSLLLYLYTQFHHASRNAGTPWRPLFVEFPQDDESNTARIDQQFMVGRALLGSPVTEQGATQVRAYFPGTDGWFDYYTGEKISQGREWLVLDAPWDYLPIHVRGGSVVVKQEPALTSAETRKNPITLLVALNKTMGAFGDLYLDDGDSLQTFEREMYTFIEFASVVVGKSVRISNNVRKSGYADADRLRVKQIVVYGLPNSSCTVTLNGDKVTATFNQYNAMTATVDVGVTQQFTLAAECA